ncbi:winged helix-turn-helix transcriptional regulator [Bacteroidia bacterium]|nr:winged helix-turn-helix transcriptional regulator [Bacteroidia bacterium]
MFSFYDESIYKLKPIKTIEFSKLIDIVRSNPYQRDYKTLRSLSKDDDRYKRLKKTFPRVNANCVVKYHTLREEFFNQNYVSGSGYIYLDIDGLEDARAYKKEFIQQYGELVAMVSLSSGGRGLSILVRISENIESHQHYMDVLTYVKDNYFNGITFDEKAETLSQCWFISYDPEVYSNDTNVIDVSCVEKCVNQGIIPLGVVKNTLKYAEKHIKNLSFYEIYQNITTSTPYSNKGLIDINPIDYSTAKSPRYITDGTKRNTYTRLIHILVHLNPEVDPKWLLAYIYKLNERCAHPKMSYRDLQSLFNWQYNHCKSEEYLYSGGTTKSIHISSELGLSAQEKSSIANKITGKIRSNKTKEKISAAIEDLRSNGKKITNTAISKVSGLSRKTVIKHMEDLESTNLDEHVNELIRSIDSKQRPSKLE